MSKFSSSKKSKKGKQFEQQDSNMVNYSKIPPLELELYGYGDYSIPAIGGYKSLAKVTSTLLILQIVRA